MNIPIVAYLPANIDACALYRMFIPHLHMPRSRFVFKWGPVTIEEFAEAQVAVVQRQVSAGNLEAIRKMKAHGMKVIYDTDDNLWALPAANPGKRVIDQMVEGFGMCAAECDLITVSTRGLQSAVKSALRHLNKEVVICPNAIDSDLFQPPSVDRDPERIVIGWAGSNTHGEDIQEAWGILPDVLEQNTQVHMEFVGMDPPYKIRHHPRVKTRRWIPVGEFMSRFATWAWDITIAPIADNRFNRSKSNIKMLEAASLGIPCLTSMVAPYEEFCALADTKWLLCLTQQQWRDKLRTLIHEPDLRYELVTKMQACAKMWYNIERLKANWLRAYNMVLP